MPIYPTTTFACLANAYEAAGIDLQVLINANAKAIQAVNASPINGGTPSPIPQKAYADGSTPHQQKCADVAYIVYQIALLEPGVDPQQAKDDYCANHEGCFVV